MTRSILSTSLVLLVGLLGACSGGADAASNGGDAERSEGDAAAAAGAPASSEAHEDDGTAAAAGTVATNDNEAQPGGEAAAGGAAPNGDEAIDGGATTRTNPDDRSSGVGDKDDGVSDGKAVTPGDWMSQIRGLGSKALNAIYLPATHDSGTYGIISVYNRPVTDVFAPDDGENTVIRLGEFVGVADKWSKAQDKTILEQLNDGVRVIDLRPCVEKNGTLRVCHGLYAAAMDDILNDVATFAGQHPKELVMLTMQTFAGMGDSDHARLITHVQSKLAGHLLSYQAGEVSPTKKLSEVWATGKSVAVSYDDARRAPEFMPSSLTTGSWTGDIWQRDKTRARLEGKVYDQPTSNFFSTSGPVTPDSTLITNSMDPLGNYPKSLEEVAAATNPVVLGWLKNEWSNKALNIISVDFYEHSCIVPLTQFLNGAAVSFDGCNIGKDTLWGKWALAPYGRGAGTPMTCADNEEERAGLCYDKCQAGYQSPTLFPYLCQKACPAGYRDDGLTCFRDAQIVSANTSSCPWYDACGVFESCSKCPDGFSNDGCTCRMDPKAITKDGYNRGVGRPLSSCAAGTEKSGLLCYPACKPGYVGNGPLCTPQ